MKTPVKIIFLLVSLLCVMNINAKDITYVKECEKMDKEQEAVYEYAKKLLQDNGGVVLLPNEIFSIIGDTAQYENPEAKVLWDKAYFKRGPNWKCTLIIPLRARTPIGVMNSFLYVRSNNRNVYHRSVVTTLPSKDYLASKSKIDPDDSKYSGYAIHSNIEGVFLRAFYYVNGKCKTQIEGVMGNEGVVDSKIQYNQSYKVEY